jgi:predicted DNA-binding WGR domain protein
MRLVVSGSFSLDNLALAAAYEDAFNERLALRGSRMAAIDSPLLELRLCVSVFNPRFGTVPDYQRYSRASRSLVVHVNGAFEDWVAADAAMKARFMGALAQDAVRRVSKARLPAGPRNEILAILDEVTRDLAREASSIEPDRERQRMAAADLAVMESLGQVDARSFAVPTRLDTVVRAYRRANGRHRYREFWFDGRQVVEHWGIVGKRGRNKASRVSGRDEAQSLLDRFGKRALKAGYRIAAASAFKPLRIRLATPAKTSRQSGMLRRHRLEDLLDERLGWAGLGYCDGGDAGGTTAIYCMVVDRRIARSEIAKVLAQAGEAGFAVVPGD